MNIGGEIGNNYHLVKISGHTVLTICCNLIREAIYRAMSGSGKARWKLMYQAISLIFSAHHRSYIP